MKKLIALVLFAVLGSGVLANDEAKKSENLDVKIDLDAMHDAQIEVLEEAIEAYRVAVILEQDLRVLVPGK